MNANADAISTNRCSPAIGAYAPSAANVHHVPSGDPRAMREHPSRMARFCPSLFLSSRNSALSYCREAGSWTTVSNAVKNEILEHAALAQTIYKDDLPHNMGLATSAMHGIVPSAETDGLGGWRTMTLDSVDTDLGQIWQHALLSDGHYSDASSGLVFQLFENPEKQKVVIAFGGTSAGRHKGDLPQRVWRNRGNVVRQWRTNFSSATGIALVGTSVPESYKKAAELAGMLSAALKNRDGDWGEPIMTGHSLGAALAVFSAAQNGLHATCFGTPELGKKILEDIGAEKLSKAVPHIRHIFVNGDPAPSVSRVLPEPLRWQAHVGTIHRIDAAPDLANAWLPPLARHDQFFVSQLKAG